MSNLIPFNLWAYFTRVLLSFFVSFVWFTIIFREPYLSDFGKTAEQLALGPSASAASILQLAGYFVMAYILGWLMVKINMVNVQDGLLLAQIVWIGFVAAVLGPMYAFQAFSLRFFLITTGNVLVSLLIMGQLSAAGNNWSGLIVLPPHADFKEENNLWRTNH